MRNTKPMMVQWRMALTYNITCTDSQAVVTKVSYHNYLDGVSLTAAWLDRSYHQWNITHVENSPQVASVTDTSTTGSVLYTIQYTSTQHTHPFLKTFQLSIHYLTKGDWVTYYKPFYLIKVRWEDCQTLNRSNRRYTRETYQLLSS